MSHLRSSSASALDSLTSVLFCCLVCRRTFVICSLCQFEHELQPKQPPTSAAAAAAAAASAVASEPTDAELVRLIPINALLMDAIGHKRQLTRMVCEQQQQLQDCGGATRCTYPSCAQPALFWCEECEGELCAAHDRDLHPEAAVAAAAAPSSSAAHRRIPLSERTSARHAKMAARLAANGGKIRDAFFGFKRRTINRAASLSAHLDAEIVRVERDVLGPIRAEIALNSAADLAVKTVSAEIAPLSDVELLKHESRINQLIGAALPREGLLAELSAERLSDLKRFLRTAGVSLVSRLCDLTLPVGPLRVCACKRHIGVDSDGRSFCRCVLRCDRIESTAWCIADRVMDSTGKISSACAPVAVTPSRSSAFRAPAQCVWGPLPWCCQIIWCLNRNDDSVRARAVTVPDQSQRQQLCVWRLYPLRLAC